MTTTTTNTSTKKMLRGIIAIMMLFFFYSCAKKTTVAKTESATEAPSTSTIPDSKGQVQIKRDVNSNYVIQINVQDLKELSSLDPNSTNAYIVWMDTDGQAAKHLGQINNNTGWLTDKSKATFEAVTEFKPTKVFITSEITATAKTPGKNIIWSTNRF